MGSAGDVVTLTLYCASALAVEVGLQYNRRATITVRPPLAKSCIRSVIVKCMSGGRLLCDCWLMALLGRTIALLFCALVVTATVDLLRPTCRLVFCHWWPVTMACMWVRMPMRLRHEPTLCILMNFVDPKSVQNDRMMQHYRVSQTNIFQRFAATHNGVTSTKLNAAHDSYGS